MMTKNVTFQFTGKDAEKVAQAFYTWYVDGGLEDQVVDTLSNMTEMDVETTEIDNENLIVTIQST